MLTLPYIYKKAVENQMQKTIGLQDHNKVFPTGPKFLPGRDKINTW